MFGDTCYSEKHLHTMSKPIIISSSESITKWAYKKSKHTSMAGMDEVLSSLENADLLLTLASDKNCPRRAFVLRCLYSMVGTIVSKHLDIDIVKIHLLLDKANASSDVVILNWVNRTRIILRDLRKYDYVEWCQGGFSQKDLPNVN